MLSLIFSFSLCLSHLHIHRQHMLTKLQTLLLFWHLANSAKSAGSLCLLLLLWYHTHCFQGDIYKTSIICFASEMHCFPAEQRLTSMAEKMMNNSEAACPDVLSFPSLKQFQEFLHSWCLKSSIGQISPSCQFTNTMYIAVLIFVRKRPQIGSTKRANIQ